MKTSYVTLFLWSILTFSPLYSQLIDGNQRIETFGNEQGFLQNTISAISSDNKGHLWFATPNGLIRYDGYSFDNFSHDPKDPSSLPDNFIINLLRDKMGRLWIGTKEGLCLYFSDEERFLRLDNTIRNETFIKEDHIGNIWIGKDSKLHVYESEKVQFEDKYNSIDFTSVLKGRSIKDILFISSSEFLLVTNTKIYKVELTDKSKYTFKIKPITFNYKFRGIKNILQSENSFWIGTFNGLHRAIIEHDHLTIVKSYFTNIQKPSIPKYYITSLFLDSEKQLWIGTFDNGMLRYNAKKDNFISYRFNGIKNKTKLSSNRIFCFYEDSFGVLWTGTVQGGINKLDKNQKPFYNYAYNPYDDSSISGNLITDITEEKDGKISFAFFKSAICQTEQVITPSNLNSIKFRKTQNKLQKTENLAVLTSFTDTKGYRWIGTANNVFLYDKKKNFLHLVKLKKNKTLITTTQNWKIDQPDEDHILIGGSNVTLLENPWKNILKHQPVSVTYNTLDIGYVNDFIVLDKNNYWFATRKGIFKIALKNNNLIIQEHLSTTPNNQNIKLSHNNIFSIHQEKNSDILWLGSFGGGIMKLELDAAALPKKIKSYHMKDGLPNEAIYGILEDSEGMLWISTDRGICKFDTSNETFDVYNVNDGLSSENYRQSSYLMTKSGLICIGGINGLTVFDPKKIKKNQIPPKIILSNLKINNQVVKAKKLHQGNLIIEKSIAETKKLNLEYANRNISLDIIVQHYATPKNNNVLYKLEGINEEWVENEHGKATATYTNLSPGTYTLKYKGTNGDGIWTTETNELIIHVFPPWYLKWWSLLGFGVLGIIFLYLIFRYTIRQEKLRTPQE